MTIPLRSIALLAATAGALVTMAAPAEAGRKTGTWKYSPEAVYQYQRAQQREAWAQRHRWGPPPGAYGRGYGYGYRQYPRWDNDDGF